MSSKQGKLLISWHSRRVYTQFIKEYHHVYLVEGKKEGTRTWPCSTHLGPALSRVCSYTLLCVDKRHGGLMPGSIVSPSEIRAYGDWGDTGLGG